MSGHTYLGLLTYASRITYAKFIDCIIGIVDELMLYSTVISLFSASPLRNRLTVVTGISYTDNKKFLILS